MRQLPIEIPTIPKIDAFSHRPHERSTEVEH